MTTGVTSTSLERAPGPSTSFVRGKSGHVPFWPGGLDVLLDPDAALDLDTSKKGLRTVPPGFSRGLRLPGEELDDDALLALDELTPTKPSADEDSTVFYIAISLALFTSNAFFSSPMKTTKLAKNPIYHYLPIKMRKLTNYCLRL